MMLKNSADRYGLPAKLLHWVIAILILGLIWLGWYMVDLTYYDPWYYDALATHKALGMGALLLALLNIGWHLYARPPPYAPTLKPWERRAAKMVHILLFTTMVAIPITGYLISISEGDAISIFGWTAIPALFPVKETARNLAINLHYYLAYATAGVVLVHACAALKHQFVDRDGTLKRML
jgi:cytochrome b561